MNAGLRQGLPFTIHSPNDRYCRFETRIIWVPKDVCRGARAAFRTRKLRFHDDSSIIDAHVSVGAPAKVRLHQMYLQPFFLFFRDFSRFVIEGRLSSTHIAITRIGTSNGLIGLGWSVQRTVHTTNMNHRQWRGFIPNRGLLEDLCGLAPT